MSGEAGSLAPHLPAVLHVPKRRERAARVRTLALLAPAILLALLFLYYPLVFILQMSFTEGSSFLSPGGPISTLENYATIANRYLPNVLVTLQLAFLATAVDLVFGFPFAYILVRKVRYRTLVRGLMVFPMFGALYIAFGMRFILLPGGPATPVLQALGIASRTVGVRGYGFISESQSLIFCEAGSGTPHEVYATRHERHQQRVSGGPDQAVLRQR